MARMSSPAGLSPGRGASSVTKSRPAGDALVAPARRGHVDEQLEVDLERLRTQLFFGKYTVHAQLTETGDEDAVHGSTLAAG